MISKEWTCPGLCLRKIRRAAGWSGCVHTTNMACRAARESGCLRRPFVERFPLIPVEEEGRLCDPLLRENFIERVFCYRRWQDLVQKRSHEAGGGAVPHHPQVSAAGS